MGRDVSYVLRSILEARELLKQGLRWRIEMENKCMHGRILGSR